MLHVHDYIHNNTYYNHGCKGECLENNKIHKSWFDLGGQLPNMHAMMYVCHLPLPL